MMRVENSFPDHEKEAVREKAPSFFSPESIILMENIFAQEKAGVAHEEKIC